MSILSENSTKSGVPKWFNHFVRSLQYKWVTPNVLIFVWKIAMIHIHTVESHVNAYAYIMDNQFERIQCHKNLGLRVIQHKHAMKIIQIPISSLLTSNIITHQKKWLYIKDRFAFIRDIFNCLLLIVKVARALY
ncbi:hypothetical protein ACJX0J_016702 [Zea mays]